MSLRKGMVIAVPIPAIAIGVIAMYQNQIPMMFWGKNIACFIFMSIVTLIASSGKVRLNSNQYVKEVLLFLSCALIILSFFGPEMEGVHRWINLGIFGLNIAVIVLPIILITLWSLLKTKSLAFGSVVAFGMMLVLFLQPDASQVTAFAIPATIMLSRKTNRKWIQALIISASILVVALSWINLDHLPPVAYVEEIVGMVANMGVIWLIFGIISLALLPIPFLLFPPKGAESISRYIGCYFVILMVSTLFGNFPVPLMGYGMSPIIGFYLSLIWYLRAKHVETAR